MKLTDMNLICIEECFEYLELRDLLSVADANKRLRKAAEFIFFRKYSKRPVFFDIAKPLQYLPSASESAIKLKGDLKTSLQLLRCFGHMISGVQFLFNGSYGGDHCRGEQRLLDQLNKYCADSLIDFCLMVHPHVAPNDKWEMFTKPFTRAKDVMIHCHLVKSREKFSTLFPKVKVLEYCRLELEEHDFSYVVGHYPHLENLSINMTKHTTSLLHLNPQLKKLSLSRTKEYLCNEFTFRNLIEPMKNLEELELSCCGGPLSNFIGNKIKSKSIKKFDFSPEKGAKYPFLFDQLEALKIEYTELTPHFYAFINQHQTIKKLDISCSYGGRNANFSRISEALPSLIELHFGMYSELLSENFSVNDFLCCVSGFKSLKRLCYKRLHSSWDTFYDELRKRMAESPLVDQWRMSLNSHCSQFTSFDLERLDHQTSQ